MTTLEEIMFHVETYEKGIITKQACEQAIGEILNGTIEPPFPAELEFPQAYYPHRTQRARKFFT